MDKNIKFLTGPTAKLKSQFEGNFVENQVKNFFLNKKKRFKLALKKEKIKNFKIYLKKC